MYRSVQTALPALALFMPLTGLPAAPDAPTAPTGAVHYPAAEAGDAGVVDWARVIRERLPVLKHPRANRWPLTLWESVPPGSLDGELVEAMLARGLAPVLPMSPQSVPLARAVQLAGAPVILRDARGTGSPWPYDLAGHEANWAHRYGAGERVPDRWRRVPSPTLTAGWAVAAQQVRALMGGFRRSGVNVDAVWLDYEGEPLGADYAAAQASAASRSVLPAHALESEANYRLYTRRLWMQLLSTYIAAPVREVFPAASVTNWIATVSLPEMPVLSWDGLPHPPTGSTLFTASNPVAYGIDTAFIHDGSEAKNQRDVDRIYMSILLRQVSADAYARDRVAPELQSIPWVARWVADAPQRRTPTMSRAAYREALRHLWLRGVDGMQVFNPVRPGYSELAVQEVLDAAAAYDEMLEFAEFLEHGAVMNYRYPQAAGDALLWSGLRLPRRALVRAASLTGRREVLKIEPWPGAGVELIAEPDGAGYLLVLDNESGKVAVTGTGN